MYLRKDWVLSVIISWNDLNTVVHQQQTHKRKIKSLILSRMQRGLCCFFSPSVLFQYLSPLALSTKLSSCHSSGHIVLLELSPFLQTRPWSGFKLLNLNRLPTVWIRSCGLHIYGAQPLIRCYDCKCNPVLVQFHHHYCCSKDDITVNWILVLIMRSFKW